MALLGIGMTSFIRVPGVGSNGGDLRSNRSRFRAVDRGARIVSRPMPGRSPPITDRARHSSARERGSLPCVSLFLFLHAAGTRPFVLPFQDREFQANHQANHSLPGIVREGAVTVGPVRRMLVAAGNMSDDMGSHCPRLRRSWFALWWWRGGTPSTHSGQPSVGKAPPT